MANAAGPDHPKYSVCVTTKNDFPTVKASLDALVANTSRADTEIVVVDAESTDGQLPVLQQYASSGLIKLIVTKCNRGEGRQIAFTESSGEYVIAGIDTDDVVGPGLQQLLALYHKEYEGVVLQAIGVTIAPRKLVDSIGGWKPLARAEDYDFWKRAEDRGLLRRVSFSPFAVRVRRRHTVTHTMRQLWMYAEQGRTPIVSWKWEPAWALIRFAHYLRKLGRGGPGRNNPRNP
ncbi:MAG TPA: glycosyltransferase family 2 protein [Nitrososphaerales archaeon]|nr:glycosyltransferase family 2 protein [Nitrososphaerales archaeon]